MLIKVRLVCLHVHHCFFYDVAAMAANNGDLASIRCTLEGVAARDILMSMDGGSGDVAVGQVKKWKSENLPFLDTQRIKFGRNLTNVVKSMPQLRALLSKTNDKG